jgi:hypothetical protein
MKLFKALALTGILFAVSCSTLFNGTTQDLNISADQSSAKITVINDEGAVVYEGGVPAEITLPRANAYTVKIEAEGYATQTVQINKAIAGWFWGNCLLGGVVGMIIDGVSGAMWQLDPTEVDAKLAVAMTESAAGPMVTFYTKDDDGELRYVVVPLLQG